MDNQLTLPPSPERPNYQPSITEQRHPPQKWVLVFGRFVCDVTTQIVNIVTSCVARLFNNEQEDTHNEQGSKNEKGGTKKIRR